QCRRHLLAEQHQGLLVIDDEYRLAPPTRQRRLAAVTVCRSFSLPEIDLEAAAGQRPAVNIYCATVIGDDAVNHSKPESGPRAERFRREEWFEDALQGRRVHAVTTVAHGQANVATGGDGAMGQRPP